MANSPVLKPLDGVRVLDFSTLPPAAACTVLLVDLGAEVIRVEPPAQTGKPSLIFGQVALGRAKRSITLDQRNPASVEVLARLAAKADVVVENARPGSMEARASATPTPARPTGRSSGAPSPASARTAPTQTRLVHRVERPVRTEGDEGSPPPPIRGVTPTG